MQPAKKFIHEQLQYYYYWNTELPQNVSYTTHTSIEDFFNDLLVKKDRWSWMETGEEYAAEEQGASYGTYGASLAQPLEYYRDYDVKVRYVFPGSPFDKAGVKRGWTILYINGKSKDELVNSGQFNDVFFNPPTSKPQTFVFRDLEGKSREMDITAAVVLNSRPGLITRIFDSEDWPGLTEKVGYFNYLGFQAGRDMNGKPMIDDIKEAMQIFRTAGVRKLILDLRYNGGGDSRASDTLINYLAPASSVGQTYVTRTHNSNLRKYDKSYSITRIKDAGGNDLSLNLDKLYIITGHGTASASEMTLNGLKTLMNVEQVGDTTYGKPNGMYVLMYPDDKQYMNEYDNGNYAHLEYAFLPICFYNCNGAGQNIPDDGLKPVAGLRPDDLYHDFGPGEDNIAACLYHIVNGSYPPLPAIPARTSQSGTKSGPSMRDARLPEESRDPNYGIFKDNSLEKQLFFGE
jgi:C-terminal processing protease CtpA/Prc